MVVKTGPMSLEKIFKFCQCLMLNIRNYVSLKKGGARQLIINLNLIYSIKHVMCQVWLKLAYWFWRRSLTYLFLISSIYFYSFVVTPSWKMAGTCIWANVNPLNIRMLRACACGNFIQTWHKAYFGVKYSEFNLFSNEGSSL